MSTEDGGTHYLCVDVMNMLLFVCQKKGPFLQYELFYTRYVTRSQQHLKIVCVVIFFVVALNSRELCYHDGG